MLTAAQELVERGEQVLVFVPNRATAVSLARLFSTRVTLPLASAALDELREAEETHMRDGPNITPKPTRHARTTCRALSGANC